MGVGTAKKAAPAKKAAAPKAAEKKEAAPKAAPKAKAVDFSSKTVAELKELAKEAGISGISAMKKADLVAALEAKK